MYVWFLRKYFIMEDDCEECDSDWKNSGKWHFDLWMGPDKASPGPNLIACEDGLSGTNEVTVDAPDGYPVDPTPLFDGATDKCIKDVPSCHDDGTKCGNHCKIPKAASCDDLATLFALSDSRFKALNPGLSCSGEVPKGTSVCQGGSCGD